MLGHSLTFQMPGACFNADYFQCYRMNSREHTFLLPIDSILVSVMKSSLKMKDTLSAIPKCSLPCPMPSCIHIKSELKHMSFVVF